MCDVTLLSDAFVVARKEDRCCWCGEAIVVGELYERESYIGDGSAYTLKLHAWCAIAANDSIDRSAGDDCWMASWSEQRAQPNPFRRCYRRIRHRGPMVQSTVPSTYSHFDGGA